MPGLYSVAVCGWLEDTRGQVEMSRKRTLMYGGVTTGIRGTNLRKIRQGNLESGLVPSRLPSIEDCGILEAQALIVRASPWIHVLVCREKPREMHPLWFAGDIAQPAVVGIFGAMCTARPPS